MNDYTAQLTYYKGSVDVETLGMYHKVKGRFKKVPRMNPALHRTVSPRRAAGRKRHKPTHGWSKARKRFFNIGR